MLSANVRYLIDALDSVPTLLSLLVPITLLLLVGSSVGGLAGRFRVHRDAIVFGAGGLCLLSYTIYALHYLTLAGCFDHLEPTIVGIIRLIDQGRPVYHDLPSASRYSMIYGPNTFVVPWLVTRLAGDGVTTLKLVSAGFALASLGLTASSIRAATKSTFGLWGGLVYFCGAALLFREKLVWLRGDPQLLFWIAIGLWGATRRQPAVAFTVIGLALGACLNTKVHGVLYFAPIVALLAHRGRPGHWAVLIFGAACATAAPFLFLRSVSLANYGLWLQFALRYGSGSLSLRALQNFVIGGYFFLPVALAAAGWLGLRPADARRDFGRRHWFELAISALGLVLLFAVASKGVGDAGEWHFFPLVPVGAWLLAKSLAESDGVSAAGFPARTGNLVLTSFLVLAVVQCGVVLKQAAGGFRALAAEQRLIVDDLRSVAERHRTPSIAMGYGGNDSYGTTFARVELRSRPDLVLDGAALMDMQQYGLGLPAATLQAFRVGAVKLWLIPRGDPPFSMRSRQQDLFSPELRTIFAQHYEKIEQSRYFDVWAFGGPGKPAD